MPTVRQKNGRLAYHRGMSFMWSTCSFDIQLHLIPVAESNL